MRWHVREKRKKAKKRRRDKLSETYYRSHFYKSSTEVVILADWSKYGKVIGGLVGFSIAMDVLEKGFNTLDWEKLKRW